MSITGHLQLGLRVEQQLRQSVDPYPRPRHLTEGNKDLKDLLGGKGASAASDTDLGAEDLRKLTQMTWGFSRDDVEAAFFPKYLQLGIFGVSPFETIDREGVGQLVELG